MQLPVRPQVATSAFSPPHVELQEVAVCFGGKLMRGNRTQKVGPGVTRMSS